VDIKIVSVDRHTWRLESDDRRKLNATVECNPLLGPQFFGWGSESGQREPVPKRYSPLEGVFFPDNAKDIFADGASTNRSNDI